MKIAGSRRRRFLRSTEDNDLGFGTKISTGGGRLINRDGSFNVERRGLFAWTPYQSLVEMHWSSFFLLTGALFILINAIFGGLFYLCGVEAFSGLETGTAWWEYLQLFFFSVQTFTTVGYGSISPQGLTANSIATADAFFGLLAFAVATGLLFARFSKPKAQILFSKQALIAPYQGGWSFQFRIANLRNNNIINLEAKVNMTWLEDHQGTRVRRFKPLVLERNKVSLFPLNWTIVHPIDTESPFCNKSPEDLEEMEAEILILISGYDDSFAQNIHDNGSYLAREIVWQAKFVNMYHPENGKTILDLNKISAYEALPELDQSS
jgi:inward rectifier potassium channel